MRCDMFTEIANGDFLNSDILSQCKSRYVQVELHEVGDLGIFFAKASVSFDSLDEGLSYRAWREGSIVTLLLFDTVERVGKTIYGDRPDLIAKILANSGYDCSLEC